MSRLTGAQMLIAAGMLDARKVSLADCTTEDDMAAAEFIWENGVFFLGEEGCDKVAAMLREKAGGPESRGTQGHQ